MCIRDRLLAVRFDSSTPEGKELIEETVRPFISNERNPYIQDQYISMLSSELDVSEQRIRAGFDNKSKIYIGSNNSYNDSNFIQANDKSRLLLLTEHLVSLVISNNITNKDLFNDWDLEMIDDTICKQLLYEWINDSDLNVTDANLTEKIDSLKLEKSVFYDNQKLLEVIGKLKIQIEREYLVMKNNALISNTDLNQSEIKDQIITIQNRIKNIDILLSNKN